MQTNVCFVVLWQSEGTTYQQHLILGEFFKERLPVNAAKYHMFIHVHDNWFAYWKSGFLLPSLCVRTRLRISSTVGILRIARIESLSWHIQHVELQTSRGRLSDVWSDDASSLWHSSASELLFVWLDFWFLLRVFKGFGFYFEKSVTHNNKIIKAAWNGQCIWNMIPKSTRVVVL